MKVFDIDDGEYYAARSREEAVAAYRDDTGQEPMEVVELSDGDLDTLKVGLEDEDELPTDETATFRQYLEEETGGEEVDAFLLCSSNV